MEKEMVTHSSVLVWRIPETGKPGGLPSMRSHRVGHDWSDLAAAAAAAAFSLSPPETVPAWQCLQRSVNNLRYVDDTTLVTESEEELMVINESHFMKEDLINFLIWI